MEKYLDKLIDLIWGAHKQLLRLTHRPQRQDGKVVSWMPRRWARALHISGHPWLWCECGDGLSTWQEVRQGRCWACQMLFYD